jgi:hypothetical protein
VKVELQLFLASAGHGRYPMVANSGRAASSDLRRLFVCAHMLPQSDSALERLVGRQTIGCEALAAMKLAAEAHGAERLRWINAALAWIEITRLRAPARDRLNGGA